MKKKSKFAVDLSSEELDNFCDNTSVYRYRKSKPTKVEKALTWKDKWKIYRKECWVITKQQPLESLENFDKRISSEDMAKYGFVKCTNSYELYSLDHKISIWYGFKNNISAKIIGHISNLRYIPSIHNSIKGRKAIFTE